MEMKDLGEEAMIRISRRTRELMIGRLGKQFDIWARQNITKVTILVRCTWIAVREEFERDPILSLEKRIAKSLTTSVGVEPAIKLAQDRVEELVRQDSIIAIEEQMLWREVLVELMKGQAK